MATTVYPIPEVHRNITRPITIDIIRQLLRYTNLDPNEFRTKMLGMSENEKVPGSYIKESDPDIQNYNHTQDNQPDTKLNRLPTDRKLTLEISENIIGDNYTPVIYQDHKPIFVDEDLRIRIKPVYSQLESKITVVLNTRDKVTAKNWLRVVKQRVYQRALTFYLTIEYHYPINKDIMAYLMVMHKMRESVEGLNEDFGHWCKRCFDNRYTVITALDGIEKMLAIQEKQVNILGTFDFDFEPTQPEKGSDNAGGWQIQFDFLFYYQRPDELVFEHPLIVHNQLLPIEMIQTKRPLHLFSYYNYYSHTQGAYDAFAIDKLKHGMIRAEGIPSPPFDDWLTIEKPKRYIQLSRVLIVVDDDPSLAIYTNELSEEYTFKDCIVRFMSDVTAKMCKKYDCFMYYQLHRWDTAMMDHNVTVDSNLGFRTLAPLTKKDVWHVTVSILTDISLLSVIGWIDILKNCDVFHQWLSAIYPNAGTEKIRCNIDNTVNTDDLQKWWNDNAPYTSDISGHLPYGPGLPWCDPNGNPLPGWWPNGGGPWDGNQTGLSKRYAFNTVGIYSIIAHLTKPLGRP